MFVEQIAVLAAVIGITFAVTFVAPCVYFYVLIPL
jgi:hypothetical protein